MSETKYMGSSGNEKYFCLIDFTATDDRKLYILDVKFEDVMMSFKQESSGKTTDNIKAIAKLLNEAAMNLCLWNTNVAMKYISGEKSPMDRLSKVYPNTEEGFLEMHFEGTAIKE